jgi:adenosylhomocysteine nucleosidase
MPPLTGIVIAMPAEARAVLGRRAWQHLDASPVWKSAVGEEPPTLCVCSGVGPIRAEAASRWLIAQGATALLLLGVAGGLHPELRPGDLVVADAAIEADEEGAGCLIPADRDQALQTYAALVIVGLTPRLGRILTVSRPIRTPAAKAALFKRYGALTVDMESGAVLRTARAAGLPCRILRAVCDPADRCLPEAIAQGVAASGRRRPMAILWNLLADPALLLPLWQTDKEMRSALKSLKSLKLEWIIQAGRERLEERGAGSLPENGHLRQSAANSGSRVGGDKISSP